MKENVCICYKDDFDLSRKETVSFKENEDPSDFRELEPLRDGESLEDYKKRKKSYDDAKEEITKLLKENERYIVDYDADYPITNKTFHKDKYGVYVTDEQGSLIVDISIKLPRKETWTSPEAFLFTLKHELEHAAQYKEQIKKADEYYREYKKLSAEGRDQEAFWAFEKFLNNNRNDNSLANIVQREIDAEEATRKWHEKNNKYLYDLEHQNSNKHTAKEEAKKNYLEEKGYKKLFEEILGIDKKVFNELFEKGYIPPIYRFDQEVYDLREKYGYFDKRDELEKFEEKYQKYVDELDEKSKSPNDQDGDDSFGCGCALGCQCGCQSTPEPKNPLTDPLKKWLNDLVDKLKGFAHDKFYTVVYDPLPLDLNGDGKLSTVGTDGGINFDFNGDGLAGNTGWVGKDDGLLVFDANQDGNVTNGSELFGDNFIIGQKVLEDGTIENIYAKHGFEALASLDTNKDGIVDANDKDFDKIKVWQDKNGNGKVDAGEMLTLKELGIIGLNTSYQIKNETVEDGNILAEEGSTGLMGDINFIQDPTKAKAFISII